MKNLTESAEKLEKGTELIIGNLLRIGVIVSGLVMLVGATIFLIRHGNEFPKVHTFKFDAFSITDTRPNVVIKELLDVKSIAIMQLGVLILIATPVLRVIVSVVAFLYERDYMYVVFTLIVLGVLVFSLFF
jgi:uncharacterized membrane protein